MNTKEAIKWLEDFIDSADKGYSISFGYRDISDFRSIAGLLKRGEKSEKREILSELLVDEKVIRGEKFEKMWEELYTEYGMCPIRKNDEEGYMSNILYKILEELQQKYFPIITKVKDEKKT